MLDRVPPGKTIETAADALFNELKLGRKSDGKALLFVWAEKERVFKIEVSYDLEHVFPDVLCKRLEEGARTFMLSTSPYARRDFIVELMVTMKLHYVEYRDRGTLSNVLAPETGKRYVGGYLHGGAGIVGRGYASTVENVERELQALPKDLQGLMQPARTPEETFKLYLRSLEMGIGAPNLPLLTEASRYFRMDKPHAPGYLRRIRAYIAKSQRSEIRERGDLAAATFGARDPVLPIFMRRDPQGLWFVDEPKVWAAYHLFQDGSSNLKYENMAFAFAGLPWPSGHPRAALFGSNARPPALLPLPTHIKDRLGLAETLVETDPTNVAAWIALADLLHFEIFWPQAAEAAYERIVKLAPERTDMLWRLIDIYEMTSDVEGENRLWCVILQREPSHPIARNWYAHIRKSFYEDDPDTEVCRDRWGRRLDGR